MKHRAGVARREGSVVRNYWTGNNVEHGTQKGRALGKRHWKGLECKNGIRSRDVKEPSHLTSRKTAKSSGGRNRREQPRLEGMDTVVRSSERLADWSSWRKQSGCPADCGKSGTGEHGVVDPSLRKGTTWCNWNNWNLRRVPLDRSSLKKGAVVVAGEWTSWRKKK
jgi:hypothetical protein